MATMYNGIDEKERERLRRLAQMRAGIEEKNEADKAMQAAAGEAAEGQPVSQEWNDLNKLDEAVDAGTFRQNAGNGQEEPAALPEIKAEPDQAAPALNEQEETQGQAIAEETKVEAADDETTLEAQTDEVVQGETETEETEADQAQTGENMEEVEKEGGKEDRFAYNGQLYGKGELDIEDPIEAAMVLYSGGREALTAESFERIKAWQEGSEGIKAMHGILSPEDMQRFAVLDENGNIVRELDRENADFIRLSSFGKLGSTLGGLAMRLNDPSVPSMLYADAFGTLATIIVNAEQEAKQAGVQADALFFDQYCEKHKNSREFVALAAAYGVSKETWTRDERLLPGLKTAIEEARDRCRNGEATWQDYELLALHYPPLSDKEKEKDKTYAALIHAGKVMEGKSYDNDSQENWFSEQAELYLNANGIDTELQGIEAYTYKGNLLSCWNEAVDMLMDYSTRMGYSDLQTAMKEEGFTGETIQGLALMKLWEFEQEYIIPENVQALEKMAGTRDASIIETIGRGLLAGGAGYVEDVLSGIYTWAESVDLRVDAARVQNLYSNRYGYYDGQNVLHNQLMEMCDEGYFPNDNLNENVKEYLLAGGNPFLLGIVPEEMGKIVDYANVAGDVKDVQDAWAEDLGMLDKLIYDGSSKVGEYAAGSIVENTLFLNGLKLVFNDHGLIDLMHPFLTTADDFDKGYKGNSESAQGIHDVESGAKRAMGSVICSYEFGSIVPEWSTREALGMALQNIKGMGIQKWMINLATEDPKELLKNTYKVGKGVIGGDLQDGILTQEGGAILPNDEYLKPAERFKKSSQWLRMLGF